MKLTTQNIEKTFKKLGDSSLANHSQRYFKTGKGEYGEGDKFIGIKVPVIRGLVKKHQHLSINETLSLLRSPYHEIRHFSLLMLVDKFSKGDEEEKQIIYEHYINNIDHINNWDLVDSSAQHIVGDYLYKRDKQPIYKLAESKKLWERRVSIMSTLHFIKKKHYIDALNISKILKNDKEDLIHKAVGWMLREIGKRDFNAEEEFLKKHYKEIPRTMLRYAIEKFPEDIRKSYLKGEIR